MESNNNSYTLLLDIDALFDTRMGTLLQMDKDVLTYVDIEEYRGRERDDFTTLTKGRITTEQFQLAYAKRDMDTLKNSIITGIVPIVISYIESLEERLFRGVDVSAIAVDINTFPYTLAPIVKETIADTLYALIPEYTKVRTVSIDPSYADVSFIKDSYNGWISYSFHDWLEKHHQELLVKPMNGMTVILPKLLLREPGEEREGTDLSDDLKNADKYGLLEMVMEDFVHLEHLAVEDFCFIIPGRYKVAQ